MAIVMTIDGQLAAMENLIQSVVNVGRVHRQRRIIRQEQDIKDLLTVRGTEGEVNAWMIYPAQAATTVTERKPGHHGKGIKGGGNVFTTFQWQIDGYLTIDDKNDSEQAAFRLGWAIVDEFNSYGQLDIEGLVHQLPADIESFGYVMLANYALYHYVKIGIGFNGRVRPTDANP